MTYTITEKCIECGSCAPFCEQYGIDYIEGKYVIDQKRCTQCGTCKEYCPIDDAIVAVEEVAAVN
jgi:MinD superfamily P-loop ATPase